MTESRHGDQGRRHGVDGPTCQLASNLKSRRLAVVALGLTLAVAMLSRSQRHAAFAHAQPASARFTIEEATIAQLHAAYRRRTVTAREVTQAYIDRIEAYDKQGPYLNAIITLNRRALDEADALDATLRATGSLKGPLHGIPVVLKDNIDTSDMPTTSGVALFRDFVPRRDAFLVAKLRQAGAIILAKASLSELAMGTIDTINSVLPGFTRNPYNTAYASGGSSGGTGVAIAASFAAVGVGTDTGSSVRSPASINNLVGIRPTVGLVSRTGVAKLISQRDTPGPMARTVEDAARLLDVMAGVDSEDARTAEAPSHIPGTYLYRVSRPRRPQRRSHRGIPSDALARGRRGPACRGIVRAGHSRLAIGRRRHRRRLHGTRLRDSAATAANLGTDEG